MGAIRDRYPYLIARVLPDPVGILFDLGNIAADKVLASAHHDLRLFLKRLCCSNGRKGKSYNGYGYDADVPHGSSLLGFHLLNVLCHLGLCSTVIRCPYLRMIRHITLEGIWGLRRFADDDGSNWF